MKIHQPPVSMHPCNSSLSEKTAVTGYITDIQHFSVHDGPGIRTTVFLKGCNMRCSWCHNPETLSAHPEIQWFPERCIGCGACIAACQRELQGMTATGIRTFTRDGCLACGACAAGCYAESLTLAGRAIDSDAVVQAVLDDRPFYASSGGGVTLSGGEPLLQADFAQAILSACRCAGIHTAIESNMAWPWRRVERILPLVDLVIMDIKSLDVARHQEHTALTPTQTLSNLRRLAQRGTALIVRTPVIPGVNDTVAMIGRIAELLADLPSLLYYELIPYHALGTGKYESLGRTYGWAGQRGLSAAELQPLAVAAAAKKIAVRIQGKSYS